MTDLRELLILGLALLILFLLLRAVYVIHRRNKGQIRLSIDKTIGQDGDEEDPVLSELPNGGARFVPAGEEEDAESGAAVDCELDGPIAGEDVPVLLDPVTVNPPSETKAKVEAKVEAEAPEQQQKPQRKQKKNWKQAIFESNGDAARGRGQSDFDIEMGAVSMTAGERFGVDSPKRSGTQSKLQGQSPQTEESAQTEEPAQSAETATAEESATSDPSPRSPDPIQLEQTPIVDDTNQSAETVQLEREAEIEVEAESAELSADKIIAINVVAGEGCEFAGRELWEFLLAAGLRHDKMKILSKFEANRTDGQPVFRVANIVNPGTFDAESIDDFSTPGISMFMLLPAPINNLLAFEQMLAVARRLAEALDGRLLDSNRQEMTAQGVEQARRRIREFDMRATPSSVSSRI